MNEHETAEDIIAEMRGLGNYQQYSGDHARQLADRLEAAHKRERGDCAKLRAALKLCMDELCDRCRDLASARGNPLPCLNGCEPVRKAKAALAAPPRNCDRFGSSTQARAEWYKTEVLPRVEGVVSGVEPPFVDWLFAPATEKEGGAK